MYYLSDGFYAGLSCFALIVCYWRVKECLETFVFVSKITLFRMTRTYMSLKSFPVFFISFNTKQHKSLKLEINQVLTSLSASVFIL